MQEANKPPIEGTKQGIKIAQNINKVKFFEIIKRPVLPGHSAGMFVLSNGFNSSAQLFISIK
jgi:hypothetical protein